MWRFTRHRSRARLHLLVVGTLLIAVTGCASSTDPGSCTDAPNLTISTGTTPTFSWAPGCSISQLRVARDDGTAQMWNIQATENRIVPAVDYGAVPASVTQTIAPAALQTGATYVVLLRAVLPGTTSATTLTQKVFRP